MYLAANVGTKIVNSDEVHLISIVTLSILVLQAVISFKYSCMYCLTCSCKYAYPKLYYSKNACAIEKHTEIERLVPK